jgi:formylglycine-generating enzyme required for sulfatase activity
MMHCRLALFALLLLTPLAAQPSTTVDGFLEIKTLPSLPAGATLNVHGLWELTIKVGSFSVELIQLPTGTFQMGSNRGRSDERPVHEVSFKHPFWMSKYPVTQQQWMAVMGHNPSRFKASGPQAPVESVSWHACEYFLKRLNAQQSEWLFRFPSEAEWEYACRAGTVTEAESPMALAWYQNNSGGRTHPVGQKEPNAWGLHDMLGNVAHWCADLQHDHYEGAPSDGSPWIVNSYYSIYGVRYSPGSDYFRTVNMIRGGGWGSRATDVRMTARSRALSRASSSELGFRLVGVPQ